MYYVRDTAGTLISKLSNHMAMELINNAKGSFQKYTPKGKPSKTAFVLDEDLSIDFPSSFNPLIKLYFWKEYRLIPE